MKPYLLPYLKVKNRRLVFDLLREKKRVSRIDAAKITGLSLPTVMKAADYLTELGIVSESEETSPIEGAGRKSHLLEFRPKACLAASVIFEGRIVNAGLIDLDGNCIRSRKFTLPLFHSKPELSPINAIIKELIAEGEKIGSRVLGIGVGFPAVINPENKSIMQLPSLGVLKETPFEELFPGLLSGIEIPYFLDNDVNLSCLGEAFLRRKNEECEDLLYISLGTGCGAGILLDGSLWRGKRFRSGEIGDVLLAPSTLPEPSCSYITGFENRINLSAISRKFHLDLTSCKELTAEAADKISEEIAPYLSFMLYNLAHILDIDRCVLAGIIPEALKESLFSRLRASIDISMLPESRISIEPSVSPDSSLAGGAAAVFDSFLDEIL